MTGLSEEAPRRHQGGPTAATQGPPKQPALEGIAGKKRALAREVAHQGRVAPFSPEEGRKLLLQDFFRRLRFLRGFRP